ncbi:hypothetical protein [Dichotomicrobium thermohalophilum]|uniref:Membrane protein DUF2157 n=1 Tax=Dichotomicrobium thermohalophilum TaxID=933063 RepID=A0A397Q4D0_9HYPH|nr:hypothetical protein [Dichotomicrobium thermohalophilum]RIA55918.1 hypothetical protein BXY53_1005 [Dichotomicrobium thermohalophilum]
MPTRDQLDEAVAAGVIGRAEADRLADFLARREAHPAQPEDAEAIRFVRGFHDIFLTIGIALLLTGVAYTVGLVAGTLAFAAVAVVAVALAFYFTRRRRLTLPSIALSLGFGISLGYLVGTFGLALWEAAAPGPFAGPAGGDKDSYAGLCISAAIALSSFGYYLYFRLPFTLGQTAVAVAATAYFLLQVLLPETATAWSTPLFLALGLGTFALAMRYDLRDPARHTRFSDAAFWLHLAAAPMIVNSAMGFVWTTDRASLALGDAVSTIILIAALAVIALIIDRRAILVAGLIYFGVALSVIINRTGMDEASVTAFTVLGLGAALLLLGVGWRRTRQEVVSQLVPAALARRLPTVEPEHA